MQQPDAPTPSGYRPPPRGLLVLVGVMVLIELALLLSDRGILADPGLRGRLYTVGAFWSPLLHGATPIFALQPVTMFFTHALLHGGLLHLAMNMAVLLGLGTFVADRYGGRTVLPLFFIGALAGGAVFGLLSDEAIPMVGASGAIFAFLGVWTVWDWKRLRGVGASTRPVWTRVLVLAGINVVMFVGLSGMLAWEAHLGGFLAGVVIGIWLEARRDARLRRIRADARAASRTSSRGQ